MNFNVTTVFSPLERAALKRTFNQNKKIEAQNHKVSQQAIRSYRSTVEVKRISRRQLAVASMTNCTQQDDDNNEEVTPHPPPQAPEPESSSQTLPESSNPPTHSKS